MRKNRLGFLLILLIIVGIFFYQALRPKTIRIVDKAMDTTLEITVYEESGREKAKAARQLIKNLSREFNWFNPKTQISLVNRLAGNAGVEVNDNLLEILLLGKKASKETNGSFDIAIGPLVNLWKKNPNPSKKEMEKTRKLCLDKDFSIDNKIVRLKKPGMSLDLGGLAKGFAIEKAKEKLKGEIALISMGSSIGVLGQKPDGSAWKVGVKHPRNAEKLLGIITLKSGQALSTSGDYERPLHIINPKTGSPAAGCQSVTVVAKNAALAEVYSTAIFVMGPWEGFRFANGLKDVEVLIVKADGNLITSPGLQFEREI